MKRRIKEIWAVKKESFKNRPTLIIGGRKFKLCQNFSFYDIQKVFSATGREVTALQCRVGVANGFFCLVVKLALKKNKKKKEQSNN